MLLHQLTLHNFAGYRGRHTIDLDPPNPEQPIVLFGGLNGAGKTTILDALQLVLYGRRAPCAGRGNLSYEEFLQRSIHRAVAKKEGAALELTLSLTAEDGPITYRVHRSWETMTKGTREYVLVFRDGELDRLATERWAEIIEELLPVEISTLFFFDGERIEALADPERAGAVIATAIESLLGLNVVDRLGTDLVAFTRRTRSAGVACSIRAAITDLETQLATARETLERALQDRAARQNELDKAHTTKAAADREFERHGGALFEQRSQLEAERAALKAELQRQSAALVDVAGGSLPLLLVQPLLLAVAEQDRIEEQAEHAALLEEVLSQRDADLLALLGKRHAGAAKVAAEFLAADRQTRQAATAVDRYLELDDASRQRLSRLRDGDLTAAADQATTLLKEIKDLRSELEHRDRELAGVPAEAQIAELLSQRDRAASEVSRAQARLELADEAVRLATNHREEWERKLDRAVAEAGDALAAEEHRDRILAHSQRVSTTLDRFREALVARHLSHIEAAVLDSFRRLLRKQRLVHDLRLEPGTFTPRLFDPEGRPVAAERLSAGERQLLAIAILWGLARVAGRHLPTVIDTPLGRLDSEHRRLLVERYFPHVSHQVVLLSTDEEIDQDLHRQLASSVGRAYELRHNDANGATEVVAGYFWEEQADVA